MKNYDLLVIGSGPGGQRAAIQSAKLGRQVAVIEQQEIVGGVTAHTGTIPSKTLREAVLYLSGWKQKGIYGQNYRVKQDITVDDLLHRLNVTVAHQIDIIHHQLERNGVVLITGCASFVDANTVRAVSTSGNESLFHADKIVIATGTRPKRPADIPFDESSIIDSDGILQLKSLPRSITIVGAGVIGVEYATIFSALDAKVTLVDGRKSMLDFVDMDIVEEFKHDLRNRGIMLRLGERLAGVEKNSDGKVVTHLGSGRRVVSDLLMVAAGRVGGTDDLNLSDAGLECDDNGRLRVDECYRTAVQHIYAVGDVIGFPSLASTSAEQGRMAACHAFGIKAHSFPEYFPFGIYAVPEISMVDKTEQDLQKDGIPYETGIARLREIARGQIQGGADGMLKLLFHLEDKRLLGVHIVGEAATELVHIGQAVIAHGGGLDYLTGAVFNYPTFAEAYKVAALDAWNRMHS
jgi:NAD(P) transhydrogenase